MIDLTKHARVAKRASELLEKAGYIIAEASLSVAVGEQSLPVITLVAHWSPDRSYDTL